MIAPFSVAGALRRSRPAFCLLFANLFRINLAVFCHTITPELGFAVSRALFRMDVKY